MELLQLNIPDNIDGSMSHAQDHDDLVAHTKGSIGNHNKSTRRDRRIAGEIRGSSIPDLRKSAIQVTHLHYLRNEEIIHGSSNTNVTSSTIRQQCLHTDPANRRGSERHPDPTPKARTCAEAAVQVTGPLLHRSFPREKRQRQPTANESHPH